MESGVLLLILSDAPIDTARYATMLNNITLSIRISIYKTQEFTGLLGSIAHY
jgi:hypothetical protein